MLSVCIPVYNIDVSRLVGQLQQQVSGLNGSIEILLIDDHSEGKFDAINSKLNSTNTRYIHLANNAGRARIRNLFTQYAQYNYLLFLDCDSELTHDEFLANYIEEIKKGTKVICGGRVYTETPPSKEVKLHWKYGKTKESRPAAVRSLNPNASFMTNNFVIEKKVFEEIKLNEKIEGYGHEDTLFGYNLKQRGVTVSHIDNPVLHAQLHSNKVFVENSENALRNLSQIVKQMGNNKEFINEVKILRTYFRLKGNGLLLIVKIKYAIWHKVWRSWFIAGNSNLFLYNFYKLGYFSNIINT